MWPPCHYLESLLIYLSYAAPSRHFKMSLKTIFHCIVLTTMLQSIKNFSASVLYKLITELKTELSTLTCGSDFRYIVTECLCRSIVLLQIHTVHAVIHFPHVNTDVTVLSHN